MVYFSRFNLGAGCSSINALWIIYVNFVSAATSKILLLYVNATLHPVLALDHKTNLLGRGRRATGTKTQELPFKRSSYNHHPSLSISYFILVVFKRCFLTTELLRGNTKTYKRLGY